MKERPIIFSAPMIRALLVGEKTQTRRILKPQPYVVESQDGYEGTYWDSRRACSAISLDNERGAVCALGPYGYKGDRLWVRETHAQFAVGNRTGDSPQCVAYRATCDEDGGFDYVNNGDEIMRLKVTKWTPAIYMPRWASRITLEVTEVRVERLHDVSEEDARAEGTTFGEMQDAIVNGEPGRVAFFNARDAYAHLWAAINGADSWKANPWVWVVGFTRVEAAARAA